MSTLSEPTIPGQINDQQVLEAVLHEDFGAFTEYAFGVLRPSAKFKRNWHIDAMCHKLSQVASGEEKRLIITLPPRNLKSIAASVALPAWFMGHNPSERVVAVSYSDALAKTHANDFRRVVTDPLYQKVFPSMQISRNTDSEVQTTLRGRRYATSIEGTLTGRGGNLFIIDDPIKPGDALSDSVRQKAIDWYKSTLVTRPDDKSSARIVVVMQRIHQEDLAGYLVEQGGFGVLNLPAIATADETHDLGHGRSYQRLRGELLHPANEPVSVLRDLRKSMGPYAFSAQYQQSPVPPGGRIFKRKWLKDYANMPTREPGDRIIISWDIALSEKETGDYSVGIVLLCRGQKYFIIDIVRGRFSFDSLKNKVIELSRRYPQSTLLIEDSPISMGLIQALNENRINVISIRPDRDKQSRAISQTDLFEGRSVILPEVAHWREEFVLELLSFPVSRHDDQVDALVQGLAYQRDNWFSTYARQIIG